MGKASVLESVGGLGGFEDYFTGRFSCNRNANPSEPGVDPGRRVCACNLKDPDAAFPQCVREPWRGFPRRAA